MPSRERRTARWLPADPWSGSNTTPGVWPRG